VLSHFLCYVLFCSLMVLLSSFNACVNSVADALLMLGLIVVVMEANLL